MGGYLSDRERARLERADRYENGSPVPTRTISNGEFNPCPQTPRQRAFEGRVQSMADELAPKLGMDRRGFLRSACGMAAAFVAMNEVFGNVFNVEAAETTDAGQAAARAERLARQFVFDVQTHFVHDDWTEAGILGLGRFAAEHWNHALDADALSLDFYKFDHYVEEIFLASDTDVALISAAPFAGDAPWLLSNQQMAATRQIVNQYAGERRMLAHSVFAPGLPGWLDDIDQAIEELKPDSWKGYTIGDPFFTSGSVPYRLDDEKLVYPAYEKFLKAGIRTVCIHKGMMPADYRDSRPEVWQYANADDVGQAAKDWPDLNFMIYHSALRPFLELPDLAMAEFNKTGRIDWVTDLAEVPERYGVDNVYAEIGSSFAMCCTTDPQFAAAFMGTLLRGMGADRVVWGTDSVWYGSPQWQIEALRRLEIPADMRKRHGFPELGAADGEVKSKIFGLNAAPLYGIDPGALKPAVGDDAIAAMKREWERSGAGRSNLAYGYVDPAADTAADTIAS